MGATDDTVTASGTDWAVSFRVLGPLGAVGRSGAPIPWARRDSERFSPPCSSTPGRCCRSTG
jgi:hypothetical protein